MSKTAALSPPAAKPTPAQRPAVSRNMPRRSEDLAGEVIQAIDNRAIMGVAVSVVQDTVFLHGRVATERQRSTAERAAWSVNGVKHVRNQITVNFG
jgi:hypothetical protein